MELFISCQGVPLELFPLMQGAPAPPWCSPSYSKVHDGCLEGKIGSFKAFLEGGWGGQQSLAYRWAGIHFPNLMVGYLRPLLLIFKRLYPFILINWTLSPLWREEGLWYSYAIEIYRWSLSSFGRKDTIIWKDSIIFWRLGLDCWMEGCSIKDRLRHSSFV